MRIIMIMALIPLCAMALEISDGYSRMIQLGIMHKQDTLNQDTLKQKPRDTGTLEVRKKESPK